MSRAVPTPEPTDIERRARAYSDLLRLRAAEEAHRTARGSGVDIPAEWDDLPSTP